MGDNEHSADAQMCNGSLLRADASPSVKRTRSKPLKQGDLDSLCGLYAVVNALRHATKHEHRRPKVWRNVFETLVLFTELHVGTAEAVIAGIGPKAMWALLRAAAPSLSEDLGLHVSFRRPLHNSPRHETEHVLHHLEQLAAVPSSSVLIGLFGRFNHWTVLVNVGDKSLQLYDSCSLRSVRRSDCGMNYDSRGRSPVAIWRSAVVLIEASNHK